ncbi:MAG TPA: hypothetical protein VFP63_03025, partial [Dehalococcoidia bacterium]|nr:hypothetical protein [Dehalococcoidia bacterium]
MSRGDVPVADAAFTASTTQTISSTAASANADTEITLTIANGDLNFSNVTTATPSAATIAPGPGRAEFIGGTHPALGDIVGSLSSSTKLGLANGPCQTAITVDFTFINATTNTADTIDPVPQSATNSGGGGVLDNMWSDNGSSTFGPGADPPWNAASPSLTAAEQANGLPAQVDDYPSYLNTLFTPDGGSPVQPWARYAGAKNVSGTSVTLNLVI